MVLESSSEGNSWTPSELEPPGLQISSGRYKKSSSVWICHSLRERRS